MKEAQHQHMEEGSKTYQRIIVDSRTHQAGLIKGG